MITVGPFQLNCAMLCYAIPFQKVWKGIGSRGGKAIGFGGALQEKEMEFDWKWQYLLSPDFKSELWEAKHWQCWIGKIRCGRNWEKRSKAEGFREEEFGR